MELLTVLWYVQSSVQERKDVLGVRQYVTTQSARLPAALHPVNLCAPTPCASGNVGILTVALSLNASFSVKVQGYATYQNRSHWHHRSILPPCRLVQRNWPRISHLRTQPHHNYYD